jgi:hypothetical protein
MRVLGIFSRDISSPVTLDPYREMEKPQGLHGKERCSFLGVVQAKGERELEIRIVVRLRKLRAT